MHNKCNYARSKPKRVKLCQNYAKNLVSRVLCKNSAKSGRNYARIMLENDYPRIMLYRIQLCRI